MALVDLLARARVADGFRESVTEFLRTQAPNERITFDRHSPPVKVERVLTKVLESCADLGVERVEVDGSSGCEYYRGTAVVHTAGETYGFRFHWDCRWRAMQEGWTDYFGFPDQTRAAREFGYDCFRVWETADDMQDAVAAS